MTGAPAPEREIVAEFAEAAAAALAIERLRARGAEVVVHSAGHYPAIDRALGSRASRLGWLTFAGALIGAAAGTWLTVGTSLSLPLIVSGKPIVALPAYVPIVFECAVLCAALVNFAAIVLGARFARRGSLRGGSVDGIVVVVPAATDDLRAFIAECGGQVVQP